MDIIQLLPDSVANQIAAGEVIQRPASVIKELVENAIDAGARHIKILVCDAGKASIQVIDDGCGMSDTDARLSFERHATSKIRQANDLFALHTMGFRGEALASIAAVAQVTLVTRRAEDELGTRIVIAGSKVVSQEVVSCPVGSNFLIENLFFNIPARRKFLKSNSTEMSNIMQAFERIALVYPDVEFSVYNNGTEMLMLHSANTSQRIADVFGKRVTQQLLTVDADTTLCKITGLVGKPETAKKKGSLQYFFVNGRYMKHPYFHKAVLSAYDRLLPDGEQVSYFIYFTVNPEDIDVNIHPVKTEIKFDNEQAIWQILMSTVRNAVGHFQLNALDFDTEGKPDIPVFNLGNKDIEEPRIDFNPMYNPFNVSSDKERKGESSTGNVGNTSAGSSFQGRKARGWDDLFPAMPEKDDDDMMLPFGEEVQQSAVETEEVEIPSQSIHREAQPLQLNAQYIVMPTDAGLMLIDQNRASQRILFEQYMQTIQTHSAHTQKVLFPDIVQFSPSIAADLPRILEELKMLGFDVTDLGGNSYTVTGIPSGLGGLDAVQLVTDLVNIAAECGTTATEEVHTILATSLAKKAATPYGEILSAEALNSLVDKLFRCSTPRYTADGKLIYDIITDGEINNRLK